MENGQYNPILKSLVFFWTDENNKRINILDEFTAEFFRKTAITEMIDKFMVIKSAEPILMVMRPYQIYAVKAAKKRVLEANHNGYVFACTGSGKTLTSFKLAQLLREESRIDKVVFLIDRKDLDDQAIDEYNSFEKDCVDNSDSTHVLVKQLQEANRKLIVTTIQKMANAVKSSRYQKLMEQYQDNKIVFIIDECHRSQFGKMHGDIEKHFHNANYIGFTGTPIFEANKGVAKRTTADLFSAGKQMDACLHKYLIKDLNRLDAVIGLPANLFHGTQIPVVILVLKSKRNGNSDNILFIDASKEFEQGRDQNELTMEHIGKIVNAYVNREEIEKYAHVALMGEIEKNDYNLNIPRYVNTAEEEVMIDIEQVINDISGINAELQENYKKLGKYFDELGIAFPEGL